MSLRKWSDEDDERLLDLAEQGLSAAQIAMHFDGKSRNAVIGRLHRMGAALKRKAGGVTKRVKKVRQRKGNGDGRLPARRSRVRLPPDAIPVHTTEAFTKAIGEHPPVAFIDNEGCCWPVGELFCGSPKTPGSSYCARHAATGKRNAPYVKRSSTNYGYRRV